jgi:adenosylcobinamide kinase / adenosylcobinamide-phosphate guanylyltransferase
MNNAHSVILVTGAARSGKSEWAETLAHQTGLPVIYLATANLNPDDLQWQQRIKIHRQRRPSSWSTLEVAENLAHTISTIEPNHCLLIDSLGTWVANCLEQNDQLWQESQEQLLQSLKHSPHTIILVAEETGWGVIPAYESGRIFRDRLGALIRWVSTICDPVYLVTGGHALNLKVLGTPLKVKS